MTKNDTILDLTSTLRNQSQISTLSEINPYIKAATSDNTRRAYQADINHYQQWGGKLPGNTETVLAYLQAFASSLNPRTLSRRLTALKHWHTYQGFNDPTNHPSVNKTLIGIQRLHGKPKDKAPPLLPEHLLQIVAPLKEQTTLRALRDNALLQCAFFGAFRRSELVAIDIEHIQWQKQGIEILIPQSKTDQLHEGLHCAVPYGNSQLCPVTTLKQWIDKAELKSGPVFRRIYNDNRIDVKPLAAISVNNILRKRAKDVNLPQAMQLSSHSLRRGLASSASQIGASLPSIMRQGRWKNMNTVMEYIDASTRFEENAANHVLENLSEQHD